MVFGSLTACYQNHDSQNCSIAVSVNNFRCVVTDFCVDRIEVYHTKVEKFMHSALFIKSNGGELELFAEPGRNKSSFDVDCFPNLQLL